MDRHRHPSRDSELERLWLRQLHGELTPEEGERLRALEAATPDAALRRAAYRETWRGLAPPPETAAPDLAPQVLATLRRETPAGFEVFGTSPLSRLLAAAVLVLGITLGLRLDDVLSSGELSAEQAAVVRTAELADEVARIGTDAWIETDPDAIEAEGFFDAEPSMADAYWQALEETGGRLDGLSDGGAGS